MAILLDKNYIYIKPEMLELVEKEDSGTVF